MSTSARSAYETGHRNRGVRLYVQAHGGPAHAARRRLSWLAKGGWKLHARKALLEQAGRETDGRRKARLIWQADGLMMSPKWEKRHGQEKTKSE